MCIHTHTHISLSIYIYIYIIYIYTHIMSKMSVVVIANSFICCVKELISRVFFCSNFFALHQKKIMLSFFETNEIISLWIQQTRFKLVWMRFEELHSFYFIYHMNILQGEWGRQLLILDSDVGVSCCNG